MVAALPLIPLKLLQQQLSSSGSRQAEPELVVRERSLTEKAADKLKVAAVSPEKSFLDALLKRWNYDYWQQRKLTESIAGSHLVHLKSKHILEVVDQRHRHAGVLVGYAEEFVRSGLCTSESAPSDFFTWLGDREELDLPEYPRRFLREWQVEYLSDDELRDLEVHITSDGLLRWRANGELVNIPHGEFPLQSRTKERLQTRATENARNDAMLPELKKLTDMDVGAAIASAGNVTTPALQRLVQQHGPVSRSQLLRAIDHDLGAFSRVSRNSDAKGIYVWRDDKSLIIATKVRGVLQHTSLTHGCPVLMAGGIEVEEGRLIKITSHSGHYRPKEAHLRAFKSWLEEQGVSLDCCTFEETKPKKKTCK